MPQMAPLSWLALFILFTLIFTLFLSFSYFMSFSSEAPKYLSNFKNESMSWEW
uniref:ATP synthase F0 subunit 8 n=1 Tax=Leptestheria dahalacensis TaxID=202083 RepID=UPI0022A7B334|nr:ATP synthase F0 subunit 8 [Leptestheria dahalacensis]UNY33475.1 ATP synthase F0 subunit 8 [Leptestheria dahalacensis]